MADDWNPKTGEVLPSTASYSTTKAAIDVQIATARSWPRNPMDASEKLGKWVTRDDDTAAACIYAVDRGGETKRGPSIRFAEIVTHAWGNMRVWAHVIDIGPEFAVVLGGAHDLQTNNVFEQEASRRIMDSKGRRYSLTVIQDTLNAAASIAQRNSILKVVPPFIWRPALDACEQKLLGDVRALNDRRIKAIGQFSLYGVTAEQIFKKLNVQGINQVTAEHIVNLLGIFNAIKDGEATVDDIFGVREITNRGVAGGSPLAAEEDKGPAGNTAGGKLEGGAGGTNNEASGDGAQSGKPVAGAQREPAAAKAGTDKGKAPKAAAADRTKRGPRQDRDNDLPGSGAPPAGTSVPAKDAGGDQPKQPDQPAGAAAASTPPAGAQPSTAASTQPAAADTLETVIKNYEAACLGASDVKSLQRVAADFGPAFESHMEPMDEDARDRLAQRLTDIWEAAKAMITKSANEKQAAADAKAYEDAKSGGIDDASEVYDDGPGKEDVGETTEERTAADEPADLPWDKFMDVAPEETDWLDHWKGLVIDLWKQPTADSVTKRFEELKDEIGKLPETAFHNMKTVRFRIKQLKPKA